MFKLIVSMLIFAAISCGCSGGNDSYEKMHKLEIDVRSASSSSEAALKKLLDYTKSHAEWDRFYAYTFLGRIAVENLHDLQSRIVPFLIIGLRDESREICKVSAEAIGDCGSPAVDQAAADLFRIIRQGKNEDITWLSIEATAALNDPEKIEEAINVLFDAAKEKPEEGPEGMPQIRNYALDSIGKLSKKVEGDKIVSRLQQLLKKEDDLAFNRKIAHIIVWIDPQNQVARDILENGSK